MMTPEPDKQQGKAIDDYYDSRRIRVRTIVLPNGKLLVQSNEVEGTRLSEVSI